MGNSMEEILSSGAYYANAEVEITNADSYEEDLRTVYVIADSKERENMIREQIKADRTKFIQTWLSLRKRWCTIERKHGGRACDADKLAERSSIL